VRSAEGLRAALDQIDQMTAEYGQALPLVAARLVTAAALERRESRGAHERSDYPALAPTARRTFVVLDPAPPASVQAA
jgi:L-aspartate oxidase